jgi:CYTH domain-containing protein
VFADVQRDWLGAAAEPFFADVRAVADAARSAGAPGGRTDVEIERKFLLRALPERVRGLSARDVDQGYLPGTRFVERLRRVRDGNGERLYRTVKLGRGTTRTEVEEEAPRELFEAMWPLTEGRRVRKRRYRVPDGDLVWEVDEFTDRDLVLAEVELPSEATPADPPDWLRPYVVRDVTDEDEYVNARLAR